MKDPHSDQFSIVVCETLQDEKDMIRDAHNAGVEVTNVIAAEDCGNGIFVNDYPR